MVLVTLVLVAVAGAPASRPLSASELATCPQEGLVVDARQAFELKTKEWGTVWVLAGSTGPAPEGGAARQRLRVVTPRCARVVEVDAIAPSLDGLAFYDLDGDGQLEILMLSHGVRPVLRILGPRGPVLPEFEASVNEHARAGLTLPEVRRLAAIAAKHVKSVTCDVVPAPFAVSADGQLGVFFENPPLRQLQDGAEPPFLTPRLRTALLEAQRRSCTMTMNPDVPHGSGLACEEPVAETNKLLTALKPTVEFRELVPLDPEIDLGDRKVRLQALCGAADERVVAVLRKGKTVTIYSVRADEDLRLYACTPEEEAAAASCTGTCIHDVLCVPQPTAWPTAMITRVTLK